ncbi:sugar transferase [Rhizobium sp. Leaf262]|uniref:sugar transferase n=1 Tax=Rhizobium sp. Leaf262 TaxID=1736312 RepID=UPI001FCCEEA6|nr:sugar transferase [Rhizobium sp. Leaf262]
MSSATNHAVYIEDDFPDELYDYISINYYLLAKRLMDLLLTMVLAVPALIIIALCAVMIKRDGGPAFFSQPRVGKGGVVYHLWKLRSMVPDADRLLEEHLARTPAARKEWETMQKLERDPRITSLGRYLRKYSLDELPQLFNVFVGDMSVVGPRPMLPQQRAHYPDTAYFDLRPGLTGLWQISERNGCTFVERAKYDSRYSAFISLSMDLWIIWRTPFVVLSGTGV